MTGPILGWDVGGANVKAARIGEAGQREPTVLECPFPLWREPHRLPAVLAETAHRLGGAGVMAVTMTAELADCFTTKREGVAFVLDAFQTAFPGIDPWIYGVDGRFRSAEAALRSCRGRELVAALGRVRGRRRLDIGAVRRSEALCRARPRISVVFPARRREACSTLAF